MKKVLMGLIAVVFVIGSISVIPVRAEKTRIQNSDEIQRTCVIRVLGHYFKYPC